MYLRVENMRLRPHYLPNLIRAFLFYLQFVASDYQESYRYLLQILFHYGPRTLARLQILPLGTCY